MKFILLENEVSELNNIQETEEEYNIYIIDGKYYFYDGADYVPVPKPLLGSIIREKENQERLAELEQDPDFDPEAEEILDQERINNIKQNYQGNTVLRGLEDEVKELRRMEKYKRIQKEREKAEKKLSSKPVKNPSYEELEASIDDFMKNFLDDGPKYEPYDQMTYDRPNPYATLDPRLRRKKLNTRWREQDEEEAEKPLVLFYFDRSGSFNPRNHPGKTQLGKDLQNIFKKYEEDGQIVVQTLYYSSSVYENENDALSDGGNDGTALIRDIQQRTEGHIANVVILGDSDNSYAHGQVEVAGAVWLVFCNEYDATLQTHIRGKALTRQFFFTDIT